MLRDIVDLAAYRFINNGISRKWKEKGKKQSCYLLGHLLFHRFLDEQTLKVAFRRFKGVVSVKREHIYIFFLNEKKKLPKKKNTILLVFQY